MPDPVIDQAVPVREGEALDQDTLATYLGSQLGDPLPLSGSLLHPFAVIERDGMKRDKDAQALLLGIWIRKLVPPSMPSRQSLR